MKAENMTLHPGFPLMKQGDIVSFYHLQMPRWLFTESKYMALSLEAKVAYTFLLNRFQLSRMNGWVNEEGEVFIVFTRESLATEMQVSYRKAIDSFKELVKAQLIWEKRLGRGRPNQIYLAAVRLTEEEKGSPIPARLSLRKIPNLRNPHIKRMLPSWKGKWKRWILLPKTCKNRRPRSANPALPELRKLHL